MAQLNAGGSLERTNEGRQEAKLKGIKFGRRRTVDRERRADRFIRRALVQRKLLISQYCPLHTVYKILEDSASRDTPIFRLMS